MRPEDVLITPAAKRFCDIAGISLDELRDARARGQYFADDEVAEGWYVVIAERQGAEGKLRMVCGPEEHIIADVRLID